MCGSRSAWLAWRGLLRGLGTDGQRGETQRGVGRHLGQRHGGPPAPPWLRHGGVNGDVQMVGRVIWYGVSMDLFSVVFFFS